MHDSYVFPSVFPVTCHTQFVGAGSTFVAIQGYKQNGVQFIPQALERGATRIVVEKQTVLSDVVIQQIAQRNATLERVSNARQALAVLSAEALGYPARQLRIIGVTGTKGKTTTVFLLEHMLRTAGNTVARISTVGNALGEHQLPKDLTTPQPDYLHMFFAECVRLGIAWVVMEVSAQALTLQRVHGIAFDGVIFTNFSQEHAEFYVSREEYLQAKCSIFDQLKLGAPCVINADDTAYEVVRARIPEHNKNPLVLPVRQSFGEGGTLSTCPSNSFICPSLIGTFNAYNSAMAGKLLESLGIPHKDLQKACTTFGSVPGRMQRHILANGAVAIIDYAHTPSSFESVLTTLRDLTDHLIVVFGAGGNRDKTKRPVMGRIAAHYADTVFVTSDNPRDEQVEDIIQDIVTGIDSATHHKLVIEHDREIALKKAYALSSAHSVIAVLGKGPDEYQEVRGVKRPFSERAILEACI